MVEGLDALGAGNQVDRGVPHDARRVALLVALDPTAGRVWQVLRDAVHRQAVAVDHHAVARAVHDGDDAVGRHAIKVGALGVASHIKVAVVHAKAPDVGGRRQRVAAATEHLDERVDRRHLGRCAIDPRGALAEHQWVRMRVDEARQQRAATEIELDRPLARRIAALLKRADVQDALVEDRDRLGAHLGGHRQDRPAGDDCASVHEDNRNRSARP